MWNKWIMGFLCLTLLSACGTKKKVAKSKVENGSDTKVIPTSSYTLNNLDFHTFSGKAKTKVAFGESNQDVTLNLRIQRDKAIWISVTALLGIEVARVLITPDSVKILNKLQGEYVVKPFSYIYRYTSEGVTFATLQDLLLANVSVPLLKTENLTVASSEDEVQLIGVKDNLAFHYSLNQNDRPKVFRLNTIGTDGNLEAVYARFVSTDGYEFPQTQQLKLNAQTIKVEALLEYNKVEFNQSIEVPFTAPVRYKVIN
ncbi:DUF4292 domain-containing protein [Sphingobacterium pedocola]|uniref:DUF4292 domain-containing protein n=1 Tax=Sphingobacterium pedocola TaxID=2082722 RepID=A0ABR9T4K9_9SPHI|nr:DUF4292 domain-containing protein [Sphingobacterium pedocola]MBE8720288.1 DUF4292 domain-containing protein [Sphingobacterium pedocola]